MHCGARFWERRLSPSSREHHPNDTIHGTMRSALRHASHLLHRGSGWKRGGEGEGTKRDVGLGHYGRNVSRKSSMRLVASRAGRGGVTPGVSSFERGLRRRHPAGTHPGETGKWASTKASTQNSVRRTFISELFYLTDFTYLLNFYTGRRFLLLFSHRPLMGNVFYNISLMNHTRGHSTIT